LRNVKGNGGDVMTRFTDASANVCITSTESPQYAVPNFVV
jgi:hypothetical protein